MHALEKQNKRTKIKIKKELCPCGKNKKIKKKIK